MLYSIEPSAILELHYRAGHAIWLVLSCGKDIEFDTMAMDGDQVYGSRETAIECTCDKTCPARLVEKGEET